MRVVGVELVRDFLATCFLDADGVAGERSWKQDTVIVMSSCMRHAVFLRV